LQAHLLFLFLNTNFRLKNLSKIAENSDDNIGPKSGPVEAGVSARQAVDGAPLLDGEQLRAVAALNKSNVRVTR
jgi:hypothetical protein